MRKNYRVEAWDSLQYLFGVKKFNNHILHFAAEFSSNLSVERLKRAAGLSADAFPLIRCRLNRNGKRPYWEDMGYSADDMVTLVETDDTEKSIGQLLCREPDVENGPQLKIWIARNGGADALCVVINHMLCDAAGFKEYLYLLASLYSEPEKGHPHSKMENRRLKQILNAFPLTDKIKIFTSKNDPAPWGSEKFDFQGDLQNPWIETKKIPREKFCRLKTYAKGHGATINDVMMAAFFRAAFKEFGHIFPAPCAVDLRKYLPNREADGICNLITTISCNIGGDTGPDFESTLLKVKKTMDTEKADIRWLRGILLLELLFTVLPYRTAWKTMRKDFTNPFIGFTNIGILDKKKLAFGGNEMTQSFMTGSIKYAPYFQLAVSTFGGEMTLSAGMYGTQSDRKKIALFLNDLAGEFDGIL